MSKVLYAPLAMVLVTSAACSSTGSTSGAGSAAIGGRPSNSHPKTMDKAGVEQAVGAKLTQLQGQASKSVSCPHGLRLTVNASARCTLTTQEGATFPVTATVSSVHGDSATIDVASPWVSKTLLAQLLTQKVAQRVKTAPKSVTCPRDLKSEVKATTTCRLTTKSGSNHPITVTVTSVDDKHTEFKWSVIPMT